MREYLSNYESAFGFTKEHWELDEQDCRIEK